MTYKLKDMRAAVKELEEYLEMHPDIEWCVECWSPQYPGCKCWDDS